VPSAQEASGQQSAIQSALDAGLNSIAQRQQVQFQRYSRLALAADGSVFWIAQQAVVMTAIGSLHYASDLAQDEDETASHNTMIFSSEQEITQLNAVSPSAMWIGSWPIPDAPPLRVAFSRRGNFYPEASVWHYDGIAVLPVFSIQLLNSPADIPPGPIVSNSLPIWLAQTTFGGQTVPCFPSFLTPPNLVPPYIVAHIEPGETETLAAAPLIGPWPGITEPNSGASPLHDLAGSQLCRDEVTLTLYNDMAWQYLVALYEASYNGTAPFGFANSPAIQDDKRPQVEIATLAQKKIIHISANYLQGTADAVARRLILEAMLSEITVIGGVTPTGTGASIQPPPMVSSMGNVFD
jgi:hypothetical protein